MARPFDWAPLAEADPLPGEPHAIRDSALQLRNMGAEITSQVEVLHRLDGPTEMKGNFLEELRASAKEVIEKLEQVRDRYMAVSGYLMLWADELEDFQTATLKFRDDALDAERQRNRDPQSDLINPHGLSYQGFHATGLVEPTATDHAEQLLAQARRELQRVLDDAADRDRYWGRQIGHAIDDKLTDGFWDHVHNVIERHKGLVDNLNQALGYVTTGVALAAIAFPPAGAVAIGLTAASLVVHSVEYEAGEGSWIDIALDAGALVSFGGAKLVSRGLERTFEGTREAAAEAARREAEAAAKEANAEIRARAMKEAESASSRMRRGAERTLETLTREEGQAGHTAARDLEEARSADVGFWKPLAAGSREDAHLINDTRGLLSRYSEDQAVQRAGERLDTLVLRGRVAFAPAATVDLHDKAAVFSDRFTPHDGHLHRYNEWKERFVMSGGEVG